MSHKSSCTCSTPRAWTARVSCTTTTRYRRLEADLTLDHWPLSSGVTKGKIDYYNLDGGSMYLSTSIVNSLAQVIFTYAYDSRIKTYSHNYSSMLSLTATYSSTGRARSLRTYTRLPDTPSTLLAHAALRWPSTTELNATSSGCNAGATWCMHDTVINQHPYNPNTYDLEADYTQFDANHPVTTIYLKQSIRS